MENWLRTLLFQVNSLFTPTTNVTAFPITEEIDTYLSFSAMVSYELLLFSLALWAGIQRSRCPVPENRIGTRRLRDILIQGNVTYFLAWVPPLLVYWALTDINSILLCLLVFLTVSLTASVGCRVDFRRTKPWQLWQTQYLSVITNLVCSLLCIAGCQIILNIRSVVSSGTSANTSQHDSRGKTYSLIVFRDHTTHGSVYNDTSWKHHTRTSCCTQDIVNIYLYSKQVSRQQIVEFNMLQPALKITSLLRIG